MVRKTKEDTQATYEALLDAAEREFRTHGVTKTTLANVAQAAGMTRGAIYWHFKDKSALFQAMCDRAFLPMQALLNELANAPERDPLDCLRQVMKQMLTQATQNPRQRTVFDILFHRCEKTSELAYLINENENRAECQAQVEEIVKAAVKQNLLPPDTDTWLVVQSLHAYLIGLIHEWLVAPEAYDLAANIDVMVEIYIAGISARTPRKKSS